MNIGTKEVIIIAAVAAAWFMVRRASAAPREVVSYAGTIASPEQASMLARQDAAFSGSPDAFVSMFH